MSGQPSTVMFAAGGGGDAISAASVARTLADRFTVSAIVSWSWDRLLIDPTPGPRSPDDFDGLVPHGGVWEVPAAARLRVGTSTLPRLAASLDRPILLADPRGGAEGLAAQLLRAVEVFEADQVMVVDVGGDLIAQGDEPGLRSPLADSLALAGAVLSTIPTDVLVTGAGLDGELSTDEVHGRLVALGAEPIGTLSAANSSGTEGIWAWHPSEANGILAAAAAGWRGMVESQREKLIEVTDAATEIYRLNAATVLEATLAAPLSTTRTLDEAEEIIRTRCGRSDIDIERQRVESRRAPRTPEPDDLAAIDRYASAARGRGTDALTLRRVLELCDATSPASGSMMRQLLELCRPNNFRPPLYLTGTDRSAVDPGL